MDAFLICIHQGEVIRSNKYLDKLLGDTFGGNRNGADSDGFFSVAYIQIKDDQWPLCVLENMSLHFLGEKDNKKNEVKQPFK